MNIALVGNPNCGKSTLFSALTGEFRRTGNFAGVTTDLKTAKLKGSKDVFITDLAGVYSLSPQSPDGKIVIEYLKNGETDVIINVVDGTNLERGLFLTTLLTSFSVPTVIAVNMSDELKKKGVYIDREKLSALFGAPVVFVSALKKKNLDELIIAARKTKTPPKRFNLSNFDEIGKFVSGSIGDILKKTKERDLTQKIDALLLNKYLGLPLLFIIITAVYYITMKVGGEMSGVVSGVFNRTSAVVYANLVRKGVTTWFSSLVCFGVISGVGTVLSFFPQVVILFFFMTVMEESGYSARIAFLTDRLFKCIGLGGKSVIPLVLSSGCTVNGVLSTRIIEDERERKRALFLVSFMPCSAKTAVVCWLSSILFGGNPFIPALVYFLSLLVVAVCGRIMLKADGNNGGEYPFEVPNYRLPHLKIVFNVLLERAREFILKAGSVVFITSVVLWFLKNFGLNGYGANSKESFIYLIGDKIKYVFYPLGFGNAESSVSLLFGIFARESVAESLRLLTVDVGALFSSPFSAFSFLAFFLFSPPCLAALSTLKKELKKGDFIKMLGFSSSVAYAVAFLINGIGQLCQNGLLFFAVFGIIVLVGGYFIKIRLIRSKRWKIKAKRNTTL